MFSTVRNWQPKSSKKMTDAEGTMSCGQGCANKVLTEKLYVAAIVSGSVCKPTARKLKFFVRPTSSSVSSRSGNRGDATRM